MQILQWRKYTGLKLKYGKPRLSESTLTQIGQDTPNLAQIYFLYFELFRGVPVKKKNTLYHVKKHPFLSLDGDLYHLKRKTRTPLLGGDMHFGSLLASAFLACWFSFSLQPQRFVGQIYQDFCQRETIFPCRSNPSIMTTTVEARLAAHVGKRH